MREELLTEYLQAGFSHLKEMAGLPEGLLPDFGAAVRQLGDEEILKLGEPGLRERVKKLLDGAPDPDTLTTETWQQAIAKWPPLHQILTVTMAFLRVCERVEALERRGALKVDFALVRGLTVIAYAPFAPNGDELVSRLTDILGGTVVKPAELLNHYLTARVEGDADTLADIDRCILENPAWREWSDRILAAAKDFPFPSRVIGISPPLTSELKQIMVNMMQEVCNAHHSRNYPN